MFKAAFVLKITFSLFSIFLFKYVVNDFVMSILYFQNHYCILQCHTILQKSF